MYSNIRIRTHTLEPWQDKTAGQTRLRGSLIHQALEFLPSWDGRIETAIEAFRKAAAYLDMPEREFPLQDLAEGLARMLDHPDIARFFSPKARAWREMEICAPSLSRRDPELLRMDRLVIKGDELWVLDYKQGLGRQPDPEDVKQVREYQVLVSRIFAKPCKGALIYLDGPALHVLSEQSSPRRHVPAVSPQDRHGEYPGNPILVFDYRAEIIRELAETIAARHYDPGDPPALAQVTVIFPHRRAKIYLLKYLAEIIRAPFLPPAVYSLEEWVKRRSCLTRPRPALSELDQAWLLYEIVSQNSELQIVRDDLAWEQFLPWGLRLSRVLEDLASEMIDASNVHVPPEDLPDIAQKLLSRLGRIQDEFNRVLEERGLATPKTRQAHVSSLEDARDRPVYICGFYALTRAETELFKTLWQGGANIWIQAENPLPREVRDWQQRLNAGVQHIETAGQPGVNLEFHQGHDLHSMLRGAAEVLENAPKNEPTAIILPEPAHLPPLLAHMPRDREFNITLGYPLSRTALAGLMNTLAEIVLESSDNAPGISYDYFLELWRNPWVRRILPRGVGSWLRRNIAETGRMFISKTELDGLREKIKAEFGEQDNPFFELERMFFHEAVNLSGLFDLSEFLTGLMALLQPAEITLSPLENEFAFVLQDRLIPELAGSLCAHEKLPPHLVWRVFLNLFEGARAAFAGFPLTDRQVMGLLETRLLNFTRVIVLDLNEGVLPSSPAPNPLLPEGLRPALGLPPGSQSERITRHHLFRLIFQADQADLFCRRGQSSDKLSGKSAPSRFWEELVWMQEQKAGQRLPDMVNTVDLKLGLNIKRPGLPQKSEYHDLLTAGLERGVSVSALNAYVKCPVKFYYSYIAGFTPPAGYDRDQTAKAFGILAHKVMETLFAPHLGRPVKPAQLLEDLDAAWNEHYPRILQEHPLEPAQAYLGGRLLKNLLAKHLELDDTPVTVIHTEKRFSADMRIQDKNFRLKGRLDRIDRDPDGVWTVVDYKTGGPPLGSPKTAEKLWSVYEDIADAPLDHDSLTRLSSELEDLQLPCYLFLVGRPGFAEFALLTEKDPRYRKAPLFRTKSKGKKPGSEPEREIEEFFEWQSRALPRLIEWLGRHMLQAPEFYPVAKPGECEYCEWNYTCPWRE